MKFLPAKPGTCAFCATVHNDRQPHNWWSVFYQMRFRAKWGRDPTHADCVAQLPAPSQERYREVLAEYGHDWTEPPAGEAPIVEPYAQSTGGV